jgi:Flp pilus assembly protein TadG
MAATEFKRMKAAGTQRAGSRWRRLMSSRDGATAIEFTLLAIPYFIIIFAIFETFVAFTAEQVVANAVDTLGRKLRTGQITYNLGRSTDMTQTQFRQAFCDQIALLISCSASEVASPKSLWLDVESYATFAAMPTAVPRMDTSDSFSDLNSAGFKFAPGGASTINMVRAFYRWQIITDLIRPYITTIRPADGSMPTTYLIVATAAFQNEPYP